MRALAAWVADKKRLGSHFRWFFRIARREPNFYASLVRWAETAFSNGDGTWTHSAEAVMFMFFNILGPEKSTSIGDQHVRQVQGSWWHHHGSSCQPLSKGASIILCSSTCMAESFNPPKANIFIQDFSLHAFHCRVGAKLGRLVITKTRMAYTIHRILMNQGNPKMWAMLVTWQLVIVNTPSPRKFFFGHVNLGNSQGHPVNSYRETVLWKLKLCSFNSLYSNTQDSINSYPKLALL